jgi:hypothetical protein
LIASFDVLIWKNSWILSKLRKPSGEFNTCEVDDSSNSSSVSIPKFSADSPNTFYRVTDETSGSFVSVRPLGELPGNFLALGSPKVSRVEDFEQFADLVNDVTCHVFKKKNVKIFFDPKSQFGQLVKNLVARKDRESMIRTSPSISPTGIAVTAIPKGLSDSQQDALLSDEFEAQLQFLPWHYGKWIMKDSCF